MPRQVVTLQRWQVVLAFVAITLSFVGGIVWVQAGRLQSCQRTYEGVREIFKPFLTPPPKPGTKQARDQTTFNNRVDELKAGCNGQIRLWWPGG